MSTDRHFINTAKRFFLRTRFVGFLVSLTLLALPIKGHTDEIDEARLRAAIVVGILRYTTWGVPIPDTITVCGSGDSLSLMQLASLENPPSVQSHQLSIENSKNKGLPESCDVVLLGAKAALERSMLDARQNTLVICDGCDQKQDLWSIKLVKRKDRIGFSVNLTQAKRNNLSFRAALLELAIRVEGGNEN